jgi:hypothetical protein
MNPLYLPSPSQLKKQFLETDFYEDPDTIIQGLINEAEQCKITKSIAEIEAWINNQVVTRELDTIWIHCTGTLPTVSWSAILRYWRVNLKWENPGYSIGIGQEGVTILQDLQYPTNGVRGHNLRGIHISTTSGLNAQGKIEDNRNVFQQQMTHAIVQMLLNRWPHLKVRPHYAVAKKACPAFDFEKEFKYLNNG